MYDVELVLEVLSQIMNSIRTIKKRFQPINSANNFIETDSGQEKLDAICMQLINIGESLKKIDKISDGDLLTKYPQVEWKKIKGMRDIISHDYFDLDAEVVYDVCENHLENLYDTVENIVNNLR